MKLIFSTFGMIIFSWNLFATPSIKLHVKHHAELELKPGEKACPVVFLNEPFSIIATVEDNKQHKKNSIAIKNIDQFTILSQFPKSYFSIINGASKATEELCFKAQAKKEGTFHLGPASVTLENSLYESNSVVVHVVKKPAHIMLSGVDLIPEIKLPTKEVFIGQEFPFTIVLKYTGPITGIAVDKPNFKGFSYKSLSDVEFPPETINGQRYQVVHKRFLLTALEEGVKAIDPCKIIFEYQKKCSRKESRVHHFFAPLFDDFESLQLERQLVHTDEQKITVKQLPSSTQEIDGIGVFDRFFLQLDRSAGVPHEPLTITMTIEGSGNLDLVSAPSLKIPDRWNCYESGCAVKETSISEHGTKGKKIVSFVLQIPEAGQYEIPAQEFTWYDLSEKKYKSLMSEPLALTIKQATNSEANNNNNNTRIIEESQNTENTENISQKKELLNNAMTENDEIAFIMDPTDDLSKESGLSWWSFLLLLLVPVFLTLCFMYSAIKSYFLGNQGKIIEKIQELERALTKELTEHLYKLFYELLALLEQSEQEFLTQDAILHALEKKGCPAEKSEHFLDFLNRCAELNFIKKSLTSFEQKELVNQGRQWLNFLRNIYNP